MFEEVRANSDRKRTLPKLALQVVIIGLFVLAIAYFMRKFSADISNLKQLSLVDVLIIGAWSMVSYTAYAYAVYAVLIDLGLKNLGPITWIRIYFVSRLVNFIITQGGNIYRLLVLKKKYDFSYTNTVGVTGFLIWINALIAVVASVFVLLNSQQSFDLGGVSLFRWCVLLVIALSVLPILAVMISRLVRASKVGESSLVAPFLNVSEFFVDTVKNFDLFTKISALSSLHFCFFVGVNYFSFQAINQPIDVDVACVFTSALVFTRYINIVPGNLGVSELVGGLMSEQMGIGFGNGLIVSGIIRMVEVLMILLIALVYGKFMALSFFKKR